jgi:hypothetical protein
LTSAIEPDLEVENFVSPREWRIDCLGTLSYPNRGELESQPSVSVAVSPANGRARSIDCSQLEASDTQKQIIRTVPIAILPALKVGDFWTRRRLSASPNGYHRARFPVSSDVIDAAKTVRLGEIVPRPDGQADADAKEFLLPFWQHPYHKQFTRAFCELLQLDAKTRLLIPHWEIIRFYWGSSTQLVETLFRVGRTRDDICDEGKSWLDRRGHAHIHLRRQIPYCSAADVARICFGPAARHAINVLENSLIAQAAGPNAGPNVVFPKMPLPISEGTTLTVSGRWIWYKDGGKSFICYRILSCSSPFPFSSLTYFKDLPGDTNPNRDKANLQPMTVKGRPPNQRSRGKPVQQADANTLLGNFQYEMLEESRFPYLDQIPKASKRQEDYTHYLDPEPIPEPEGEADQGVGHGSSDPKQPAKLQKREHQLNTSQTLSVNCKYFFAAIDLLKGNGDIADCEYVCPTPDRNDGRCTVLPLALTKKGRISRLCYLDYIKGHIHTAKLRRRAIVAKISHNKGTSYLLEAEARVFEGRQLDSMSTFEVRALDSGEVADREIEDILQNFCDKRLVWSMPAHLPHLQGKTFSHPKKKKNDTEDEYVERIYKRLKEILNG